MPQLDLFIIETHVSTILFFFCFYVLFISIIFPSLLLTLTFLNYSTAFLFKKAVTFTTQFDTLVQNNKLITYFRVVCNYMILKNTYYTTNIYIYNF